jgi:peroxiredoxin
MTPAGLAALALVAVLAACSSTAASESGGGLPGPVPEGVTFRAPPATAPPAPSFELELLNGQTVDSAQQWAERPMVLVFFESWCRLCRDQQSGINDVADQFADVVLFVGVAGQSPVDDVREYVADNDVDYPVGVDSSGRLWLKYAATEPPLVVLVSKDGRLLRGWPGGTTQEALRDQIERLAVEQPATRGASSTSVLRAGADSVQVSSDSCVRTA